MNSGDLFDIVVAPLNDIPADILEKVSVILSKDAYTTRLLLTTKVPRIIAQSPGRQGAESIAGQLGSLGFFTLIHSNDELQRPLNVFKTVTLKQENGLVTCENENGEIYRLSPENVFLVIRGLIQTTEEQEKIDSVKKINVAATLLTGGIPIRRTERKKSIQTSIQTGSFLRVFERNNPDFCVEIKQYTVSYSFLGPEMQLSSTQNFNLTAQKFREFFPVAVFNDKLAVLPVLKEPSYSNKENIDLNCRLIYSYCFETQNQNSK